jgi:hypothetical protein
MQAFQGFSVFYTCRWDVNYLHVSLQRYTDKRGCRDKAPFIPNLYNRRRRAVNFPFEHLFIIYMYWSSFRTNFVRGIYVHVTDEKYCSLSRGASVFLSTRQYWASVPQHWQFKVVKTISIVCFHLQVKFIVLCRYYCTVYVSLYCVVIIV